MYKTKEIAQLVGVHPNTVRIYEEWGFISPVPRKSNGYREYSDVHLLQMKVARTLFQCEIVQGNIRKMAREIVYASGREEYTRAGELTKEYIVHLKKEYKHAIASTKVVENWLKSKTINVVKIYSRKEVARLLDITPETLRTWERNSLIQVPRLENGFRAYGEVEVEQLRVIRSLRSAHYSINSIYRLLTQIHKPSPNIIKILNTPTDKEDIVTVTDRLVKSLQEAIEDAKASLTLLNYKIKTLSYE